MEKKDFTDAEHKQIGNLIILMSNTCHKISRIIAPNKELSQPLLEILDQLCNLSIKMRDKYS